jgi:hypothetical protein
MQGSASLIQSMYFDIMAGLKPHSLIKINRNFESKETLNRQALITLTTEREREREGGRYILKFSNKLRLQKEFT